jgi:hypothetical protein
MEFKQPGRDVDRWEVDGCQYELNYTRLNLGKKAAKQLKKERKRKGEKADPKVLKTYKNTKAYVAEWHIVDEEGDMLTNLFDTKIADYGIPFEECMMLLQGQDKKSWTVINDVDFD